MLLMYVENGTMFQHFLSQNSTELIAKGLSIREFKPLMVDTFDLFQQKRPMSNNSKNVVWFNKPWWISLPDINVVLKLFCPEQKCSMTDNKTNIKESSAIIFTITEPLGNKLPMPYEERNLDQAWIFFGLESPAYTFKTGYADPVWKNKMNWSMNYRLDADIYYPYGWLETRGKVLERDYSAIYKGKTKHAAWIVSNCNPHSRRQEYVKKMQDAGLTVG